MSFRQLVIPSLLGILLGILVFGCYVSGYVFGYNQGYRAGEEDYIKHLNELFEDCKLKDAIKELHDLNEKYAEPKK